MQQRMEKSVADLQQGSERGNIPKEILSKSFSDLPTKCDEFSMLIKNFVADLEQDTETKSVPADIVLRVLGASSKLLVELSEVSRDVTKLMRIKSAASVPIRSSISRVSDPLSDKGSTPISGLKYAGGDTFVASTREASEALPTPSITISAESRTRSNLAFFLSEDNNIVNDENQLIKDLSSMSISAYGSDRNDHRQTGYKTSRNVAGECHFTRGRNGKENTMIPSIFLHRAGAQKFYTFTFHVSSMKKAVGILVREGSFAPIAAMSGYAHTEQEHFISGKEWTEKALQLAEIVGYTFNPDGYDNDRPPGSYWAGHAEVQLITWLVYHHFFPLEDLEQLDSDFELAELNLQEAHAKCQYQLTMRCKRERRYWENEVSKLQRRRDNHGMLA